MRMCRRLGISSESSTEVGRKRGKKMRGLAGSKKVELECVMRVW